MAFQVEKHNNAIVKSGGEHLISQSEEYAVLVKCPRIVVKASGNL